MLCTGSADFAYCTALYDYVPQTSGELGLHAGDTLRVTGSGGEGWGYGELVDWQADQCSYVVRQTGFFPQSYVTAVVVSTSTSVDSMDSAAAAALYGKRSASDDSLQSYGSAGSATGPTSGDTAADTASTSVDGSGVSKQERARLRVAQEILDTERSYVSSLQLLRDLYLLPLQGAVKGLASSEPASGPPPPACTLSADLHAQLFSNMATLIELNVTLLKDLEQRYVITSFCRTLCVRVCVYLCVCVCMCVYLCVSVTPSSLSVQAQSVDFVAIWRPEVGGRGDQVHSVPQDVQAGNVCSIV